MLHWICIIPLNDILITFVITPLFDINNNFAMKNIVSRCNIIDLHCHVPTIDFSRRFANVWRGPRDFLSVALTIRFTLARLRLLVRCLRIIIFRLRRRAMRCFGWADEKGLMTENIDAWCPRKMHRIYNLVKCYNHITVIVEMQFDFMCEL